MHLDAVRGKLKAVLNVKREQQGNTLILRLSGVIDETVDFNAVIGATAPDTVLQCKEVSRINSVGVKAWVQFFQDRAAKGTKLRFVECSPSIVEQFNLIRNFACGGRIETVYLPFSCTSCKKSLVGLFKVEDLKRSNFATPTLKCTKCGANAVFDDVPEEYFRFATRPGQ